MKNICKYCKKEYEYEPKRGSYKGLYCSYECKNKFNLEDNLPQKRICEECGKEYDWTPDLTYSNEGKVKVNTKKFCSYECGKKNIYNKGIVIYLFFLLYLYRNYIIILSMEVI